MSVNIQKFFLLTIGFLLCMPGCARDRSNLLMPDHISSPMDIHESVDTVEASVEQSILPILTARCALAGCHVANGPHGLDFRTYESFVAGGEHGPAFIPGNAEESEVVEEIVSGRMPPGGPPLTEAEIQSFVDWINQQEAQDDVIPQEHGDEHEDAHEEMDVGHEEEDEHVDIDDVHDEDMDDEHDDMDDEHDDDDDEHDDDDDDDNGHDDNGHDDDDDN